MFSRMALPSLSELDPRTRTIGFLLIVVDSIFGAVIVASSFAIDPDAVVTLVIVLAVVLLASLAAIVSIEVADIRARLRDDGQETAQTSERSRLPESLGESIERFLTNADIYNEQVTYTIELRLENNEVVFLINSAMTAVNCSDHAVRYLDIFDPAGRNTRFLRAAVDDLPLDYENPAHRTGLGLQVVRELEAGQRVHVEVEMESIFDASDSELIGSYLPCERLVINLKALPAGLRAHFQKLFPGHVQESTLPTGERRLVMAGVLPFQGVRLSWSPR